jgi:hypothetical protein
MNEREIERKRAARFTHSRQQLRPIASSVSLVAKPEDIFLISAKWLEKIDSRCIILLRSVKGGVFFFCSYRTFCETLDAEVFPSGPG